MSNIILQNFSKSFGDTVVFDGFGYSFEGGLIHILMAPSGSGKTTLLNAIAGLIEYGGSISVGDTQCEGRCNISVSYMFQTPRLIPSKTVFGNIEYAIKGAYPDKAARRDKIMSLLFDVGLGDSAKLYPKALSGGMAQRAALVRAFLYPSQILLMDEPFRGLDKETKESVMEIFGRLWQKTPRTTLFVTHDDTEAAMIGAVVHKLGDKPHIGKPGQ